MVKDRCSNCKAYRIKDAEYCICGRKWVKTVIGEVDEFLSTMGVKLEGNR